MLEWIIVDSLRTAFRLRAFCVIFPIFIWANRLCSIVFRFVPGQLSLNASVACSPLTQSSFTSSQIEVVVIPFRFAPGGSGHAFAALQLAQRLVLTVDKSEEGLSAV